MTYFHWKLKVASRLKLTRRQADHEKVSQLQLYVDEGSHLVAAVAHAKEEFHPKFIDRIINTK